jgi:hypothetical protein
MNSTTPKPLVLTLMQYLPLAEKIFLAGASVGLIFLFLNLDTLVLIASLIALAVIFFLSAYRPPEVPASENASQGFQELFAFMILPKVAWIGCAVSATGIVLYLIDPVNDGYKLMLLIGGMSLLSDTAIFVFFLLKGTKHIEIISPIFFRAIPLMAAAAYILFKVT